MPLQTVVFLDYQNIYSTARETFKDDGRRAGQVDPLRLAALLVSRSRDRVLSGVRVYRGQPDPLRQGTTYGANRRQTTRWERAGCTVVTRPLRYPPGTTAAKGVGKGLDVALAVDFLLMAVHKRYDRAILMSTDTDLKPALEAHLYGRIEELWYIQLDARACPDVRVLEKKSPVPGRDRIGGPAMDDRFHLAAGVRPSSGGPELEGSPMPDVFADDSRREGWPECERRRDRNRTVARVGCVLLVAVAAALAIKRYPAWAESIKVGVIVLVVVVTWLLARDGYDRSS